MVEHIQQFAPADPAEVRWAGESTLAKAARVQAQTGNNVSGSLEGTVPVH